MAAHNWGRSINMVSLAADRGDAGLGEYDAAKAGIAALTRTAAREWGRQGITANAIAPGAWTKRGQDYAARDPEGFAKAMAAGPIGAARRSRGGHRTGRALPGERRFAVRDRAYPLRRRRSAPGVASPLIGPHPPP